MPIPDTVAPTEPTDDLLDDLIRAGNPSHVIKRVAKLMADVDALNERRAKDAAKKALIREGGDWDDIRRIVFERDGYTCIYCSSPTETPHCDHVIPLSKGGRSTFDNLATACPSCNIAKGARTPQEWRS